MIKQQWLLKLLKKAEAFILSHADVVSSISSGMLQRILEKKLPIKKLVLFPNWVNFSHINVVKPNPEVFRSLSLPIDKQLILYSGAVGEKQGLDMLLQVAEKCSKSIPQLYFIISGNGPYAEKLQQQANALRLTNLQFISLQPLEVFNHLLNGAWLHLVIQKGQASDLLLPSKLTNILAVGGLSIVTAITGTSLFEIIHQHEAGYLVAPENADALFDGIQWLHDHPAEAMRYKKNAARYASAHLEQGEIINRFLKAIV
jgi:colanic acid biosynthesis glycosyl transferase WcaI